jgi:O-antigen/teichoic acid export membrane protein
MNDPIHNAAPKAIGAMSLGFAGLTISEWAALAGLVYSLLLIGEWLWKRIFKSMCIDRGWITPKEPE